MSGTDSADRILRDLHDISVATVMSAIQEMAVDRSEKQLRALGALRTVVGVASIYYASALNLPLFGILGAALVAVWPAEARSALALLDAQLDSLWHGTAARTRAMLTASNLLLLWFGLSRHVPVLSGLLHSFVALVAMKVAGELTLHNVLKEKRNVSIQQLRQQALHLKSDDE